MKIHSFFEWIKRHRLILKCIIAFLLFWYILKFMDVPLLFSIVQSARLNLLVLAFFIIVLNQLLISNIKWSLLLRTFNTLVPFRKLCEMYMVGMFFSMFLPGSHGGDVVRAHQISKYTNSSVEGVMSVVIERVVGLMGLLIVLLVGLLVVEQSLIDYRLRVSGVLLIVGGFALLPLLFIRTLVKKVTFLFALTGDRFETKARQIYETIYLLKNKKLALTTIALSVVFQLLAVFANYIVALSLHVEIPYSFLMLSIPLILLLSMVPVTLNGIGVRDISYIGFLGVIGVEKELAFSIGLIQFFLIAVMSLFGGLVYLRQR